MPWSTVSTSIKWWASGTSWGNKQGDQLSALSPGDQSDIEQALQYVYEHSTVAGNMIDAWVSSGKEIHIGDYADIGGYIPMGSPADDYLGFNMQAIAQFYYFNDKGTLVQEKPGLTIIHELIHMMEGKHDLAGAKGSEAELNSPTYDQNGDTLNRQNEIARELGWLDNIQVGYKNGFTLGDIRAPLLTINHSYTEGHTVDHVRLGQKGLVADNLDHGGRAGSRDLMLGLDGEDRLNGGSGDDYLYGGGGKDALIGGSGNDLMHGGDNLHPGQDDIDTADYSVGDTGSTPGAITVKVEGLAEIFENQSVIRVSNNGYGGQDRLVSIEKIVATTSADTFHFNGKLDQNLRLEIDAKTGSDDTLTAAGSTTGFHIKGTSGGTFTVQAVEGGASVKINNFAGVILGGDGADDISAEAKNAHGGGGADFVSGTFQQMFGDAGNDRIIAKGAGEISGGAGDDLLESRYFGEDGEVVVKFSAGDGHDMVAGDGKVIIDIGGVAFADLKLGWAVVEVKTEDFTMEYGGQNDVWWTAKTTTGTVLIVLPSGDSIGRIGDTAVIGDNSYLKQIRIDAGEPDFDGIGSASFGQGFTFRNSTGEIEYADLLTLLGYRYSGGPGSRTADDDGAWQKPTNTVSASFFDAKDKWKADYFGGHVTEIDSGDAANDSGGDNAYLGDGHSAAVSYRAAGAAVAVDLNTRVAQDTGGGGHDRLVDVAGLEGSAFNDVLVGNDDDNILEGGDGDDVLTGGEGYDTVTYAHAESGVTVDLSQSSAQATGGAGIDTLSGFEQVVGSDHDDTLRGDGEDNYLDAGLGDDTFLFSGGFDVLMGGDGIDTLVIDGVSTDYFIELEVGSGYVSSNLTGAAALLDGVERVVFSDKVAVPGPKVFDGTPGADVIHGSNGADIITGGDGEDELYGLNGDDVFLYGAGSNGRDWIDGGSGVDTIKATADHTVIGVRQLFDIERISADGFADVKIQGGSDDDAIDLDGLMVTGIDTVEGGGGDDRIFGTAGNDKLFGQDGDDRLEGGLGDDQLAGGDGYDIVSYAGASAGVTVSLVLTGAQNTVGAGTDTLSGFERLVGSRFADTLTGTDAGDRIDGGAGADLMSGGAGNDVLNGQDGNDTLIGGEGDDELSGGNGADKFVFGGSFGHDEIISFRPDQGDRIAFDAGALSDFNAVISASSQEGADVLITLSAGNSILIANFALSSMQAGDFLFG